MLVNLRWIKLVFDYFDLERPIYKLAGFIYVSGHELLVLALDRHRRQSIKKIIRVFELRIDNVLSCLIDKPGFSTHRDRCQAIRERLRAFKLRIDYEFSTCINVTVLAIHLHRRQTLVKTVCILELRIDQKFAGLIDESPLLADLDG